MTQEIKIEVSGCRLWMDEKSVTIDINPYNEEVSSRRQMVWEDWWKISDEVFRLSNEFKHPKK